MSGPDKTAQAHILLQIALVRTPDAIRTSCPARTSARLSGKPDKSDASDNSDKPDKSDRVGQGPLLFQRWFLSKNVAPLSKRSTLRWKPSASGVAIGMRSPSTDGSMAG